MCGSHVEEILRTDRSTNRKFHLMLLILNWLTDIISFLCIELYIQALGVLGDVVLNLIWDPLMLLPELCIMRYLLKFLKLNFNFIPGRNRWYLFRVVRISIMYRKYFFYLRYPACRSSGHFSSPWTFPCSRLVFSRDIRSVCAVY